MIKQQQADVAYVIPMHCWLGSQFGKHLRQYIDSLHNTAICG